MMVPIRRLDAAVAAVLTVAGVAEAGLGATGDPEPWYVIASVPLVTLPVAARRRPVIALPVTLVALLGQAATGSDLPGGLVETIALVLLVYSLGVAVSIGRGLAVLVAVMTAASGVVVLSGGAHPANFVFLGLELLASWGAGAAVRVAIERSDLLAEQRASQERARIAGELHDVVTHSVSAMVVQASAERRSLSADNPSARSLEQIEELGRDALTELRRLLGVLRLDGAVPREPQPRLRDLPGLIATAERSGQAVTLDVQGTPNALPDGVELAVFRAVQEGLTNARKHAPGAPASVLLDWTGPELRVEVRNGPGESRPDVPGAGFGIAAMRDRLRLHGADVSAGPTDEGFLVSVRVPVGSSS